MVKKDIKKKTKLNKKSVNKDSETKDEADLNEVDIKENANVENDFFLDDADAHDYNNISDEEYNSEELDGSDLDYDEEDHVVSENDEEDDYENEDGEKRKKPFVLTKEMYNKIKAKALMGNLYAISQCISFLGKTLNISSNEDIQDESERNIINKKSFSIKIVKFCLENLMDLLQAKMNKGVIKKLLANIIKFLKVAESFDESIIILAFKSICKNINFVKMFRSYTETYIKMSVKYWLQLKSEDNHVCLEFLKSISKTGEYDFVTKTAYLGFLSIAKAMNNNSKEKIEKLSNELTELITFVNTESGSVNSDLAYKNVFMFLRKISIELNRTINDKSWNSIKDIYNWKVIHSVFLFFKIVKSQYKINDDFKLLSYPLIQLSIGILRLYQSQNFIPLKLNLLEKMIDFSKETNIFIPIESYLMEIFNSAIFAKFYKGKIEKITPLIMTNKSKREKIKLKRKHYNKVRRHETHEKHVLSQNINYSYDMINTTLKIKDLTIFSNVYELLKNVVSTTHKYLEVYQNNIGFIDLSLLMYQNLKKLCKSIEERKFKELIKFLTDSIVNNSYSIHDLKNKLKEKVSDYNLKKLDNICVTIAKKNKSSHITKRIKLFNNKLEDIQESDISMNNSNFIEI